MKSSPTQENRAPQAVAAQPTQSNLPSVTESEPQGQTLGQAAFWRPRHADVSPVLAQIPFLFWLTEAASPRLIVQMGLDDGIGYLAFCQAAERLNGGTLCLALENKTPALTPALQAEHDSHYSDFSQILSGKKIATDLPEEIDLLVLGTAPEPDALDFLHDDILPRLSESAVIVIVNPDVVLADQATRRVLTGSDRPRLNLGPVVTGGAALDVILYGSKQPERVRRLVMQQPGQTSWLAMRQAFNRLGQGLAAARQNEDMSRDLAALRGRVKRSDTELKELEVKLEKAEASEKAQLQRNAEQAARIHDLQQAAAEADRVTKLLQAERDNFAKQTAAQLSEMQCAVDDARAEHNARVEDIVALTAQYEKDLEKALEKAAKKAKAQLTEVSAHRDALLNSTSWKITSPLRKLISAVRGY